jgi:alkylation response protein AidB-like acyl-CoA dehydrogenase
LILEETGRTLAPTPLLATSVVADAILLGGTSVQREAWLPRIAAGEVIGALALEEGPHHAPENVALAAHRDGDGWSLSGAKTFVMEGFAADLYVVAARTSGEKGSPRGITLFLVEAKAKMLSRRRLHTIDSRGWADVIFNGVQVGADAVLGEVDNGFDLLEQVLDHARIALAAEMLGSATQAFEVTLDYLKTRTQFGQVIGPSRRCSTAPPRCSPTWSSPAPAWRPPRTRWTARPTTFAPWRPWPKPRPATPSTSCPTRWSRCTGASA